MNNKKNQAAYYNSKYYPTRIMKRSQFSKSWWTFPTVISVKKKQLIWTTFQQCTRGSREEAMVGATILSSRFCSLLNISRQILGAPVQAWKQYSMQCWIINLQRSTKSENVKKWNLSKKKFHRASQGSSFAIGSFSNKVNIRKSIQFSGEWQFQQERQSQHLTV